MKRKRIGILAAFLPVILLAAGCSRLPAAQEAPELPRRSVAGFYMDTVVTLECWTENEEALQEALEECGRLEALLSRTREGSDVWRINHADGAPVEVSDDTVRVLEEAARVSAESGGAFDVTIAPCVLLWDFGRETLPDAADLRDAVSRTDWRQVTIEGNTVMLPAGVLIDLGGIAKGYVADRVAELLTERGVERGVLSFGGNIVVIGNKPGGEPWRIGIRDIDGPSGSSMAVLRITGGCVVTSGIYERGFTLDGVRYHHLLDPETGWPVQNGLASVTVVTDSSTRADALSTALFVLGPEKGLALAESLEGVEAVWITRDRRMICTGGAGSMLEDP